MPYARLLLPTLVFMLAAHGAQVYAPWSVHPGYGADGLKNLYTFAWYSAHNESLFNFEGMAWPYGEHIFYTDQTPVLGILWRNLVQWFGLAAWSAPLLMVIIHLSWLLTPIPLFRILNHYGARGNIAIAGAVGYTLLAPQVARANGHFALAITIALPLAWWLAIRCLHAPKKVRNAVFLTALNSIFLLTHAYLGMITIAFTGLFMALNSVTQKRKLSTAVMAIATSALPMLGFLLLLRATDQHVCRITKPYGFFEFTSSIQALLVPQVGPYSVINNRMGWINHWEGHAYIGVSAALMILTVPLWGFFVRTIWHDHRLRELSIALVAALVLFVLACGEPFASLGEESLSVIPYLRDFRGIGRFAWPLYFVLTTVAVVLLNKVYRHVPQPVGRSLAIAFFFILLGEASYSHAALRRQRTGDEHPFTTPNAVMSAAVAAAQTTNAIAIVPLPMFHVGSEVLLKDASSAMQATALSFSFHSGLPLASAHLTRSSVTETRSILQLTAPHGYEKPSFSEALNDAQVLLLVMTEALPALSHPGSDEGRIWRASQDLFSGAHFSLRVTRLENLIRPPAEQLHSEIIAHVPFEPHPPHGAQGSHGLGNHFDCTDYVIFFSAVADSSWLHRDLEASVWLQANDLCVAEDHGLNVRFVVQTHTNGKTLWRFYTTGKMVHRFNGDRVQLVLPFRLTETAELLQIFMQGEPTCVHGMTLDDFLLVEYP